MAPDTGQITMLLVQAGHGDGSARDELWRRIYDDLRQIAHRELRRRGGGQTLQTTDLVNEAYLRLIDQTQAGWNDRLHFFAVAAKAMRHILIDYARRRTRQKRGGGRHHVPLDEVVLAADQKAESLLVIDDALTRMAALNERLVQLVECRFFGGMTDEEIAELFGVSERTVRRDWRKAKAWLADALAGSDAGNPTP